MLKKSEVLREGYIKGLRKAQKIILEMLGTNNSFDKKLLQSDNPSECQKLLKMGANPDVTDEEGWTPLHFAADEGNVQLCSVLLRGGANVNAETNSYETPLHRAAYNGHADVCDLLTDNGANINAEDKDGDTPM